MFVRQLAIAVAGLWISAATAVTAAAEVRVLHYVSADDLALQLTGDLPAVHEYVEVTVDPDGPDRIEVGYQHVAWSASEFLEQIVEDYEHALQLGAALTPADLGRVDIPLLRRVAMTGTVTIGPGSLTWQVVELTPTTAWLSQDLVDGGHRPSPFQAPGPQVTVTRDGGSPSELGDAMTIVVDGQTHAYRRIDPEALALAGALSRKLQLLVAETRDCLVPLAGAYLAGETSEFSDAAIAMAESGMAGAPGLAVVQQHGYGPALTHFLDGAVPAGQAFGAWVAAEVDSIGLEQALAAFAYLTEPSPDLRDWRAQVRYRELIVLGMHILPGDDRFPDGPIAEEQVQGLSEAAKAAYLADPWSQTGDYTSAVAGFGWVSVLMNLLIFSCLGA